LLFLNYLILPSFIYNAKAVLSVHWAFCAC